MGRRDPPGSASWPNDIAVNVVNQLVTAFLPPRTLPKLDLHEHGVPPEFRTAVVIPTLFGSVDAVREALENLEVQFLANREAHLHFAVLSDFTDSPTETREGDDAIVAAAVEGVRALNARYADGREDAFYLFHRPRRWNPHEGVWMGWERKRGKLAEFNRFVLGQGERRVLGDRGRRRADQAACATSSRSTPTRCSRPTRRPLLVGALAHPAQPRGLRSRTRPRGARLRHPAAAGRRLAAERQPLGLRVDPLGAPRRGPVHHRGLRRLSGPVRRGELHRQGDLRRRRVRAGDARPLPREHAALARPDRGELRARRPGHRHHRLRRLPHPLPDLHPAQAPLDPRRLAAAALADAGGCRGRTAPSPTGCRCSRAGRSSTTCAAAPSRWRSWSSWSAGWLLLPGSPIRWTLLGLGAIAAPWIVSLLLAVLRPPLDKSWRAYYAAVGRDAIDQRSSRSRWPSSSSRTRPGSRPTRSSARCWRMLVSRRHLLEWQTASQTERGHVRLVAHRLAQHVAGGGARGRRSGGAVLWRCGGSSPTRRRLRGSSPSAVLPLDPGLARLARHRPRAGRAARSAASTGCPTRAGARRCATRCCTGASSTGSSPKRPSGSRPTTSRRTRSRWWRCAPRPPTSASSCWPP